MATRRLVTGLANDIHRTFKLKLTPMRRFSTARPPIYSNERYSAPILASVFLIAGTLSLENEIERSSYLDGIYPVDPLESLSIEAPVDKDNLLETDDSNTTDVINWSGTHKVTIDTDNFWEPESIAEVEEIVKDCNERGQSVRPLGASLSPNGLGLNADGMISMANLDEVVEIDKKKRTITVQAGMSIQRVIEALRPHGLTLPNLASIAEQHVGGFIQVGAHGTGRTIAPVDDYVTKLKIVTPGLGTIVLSKKENARLFELAKVGLGCLGVVVEVTMECVPAHRLVEHTFVLTRKQAKERLETLLKKHKHMRYMWIPYTDTVVCVTNDPAKESGRSDRKKKKKRASVSPPQQLAPLTNLLAKLREQHGMPISPEDMKGMGFGELRDELLAFDPLNVDHVKRCNMAEAEFWSKNEGYQTKPSDQLLQFDCGGQQWVLEVCFPTGTQENNNGNDMEFMERLLKGIEENNIPAHAPIEQRWSASSSSKMSPAHGAKNGLHSWVGIINYLPSDDPEQRQAITDQFTGQYSDLVRLVGRPMKAVSHWAKLEKPQNCWKAIELAMLYQERFPLDEFNKARAQLDPKNILSSPLLDLVLGSPKKFGYPDQ